MLVKKFGISCLIKSLTSPAVLFEDNANDAPEQKKYGLSRIGIYLEG
jgi:hypothetical protein